MSEHMDLKLPIEQNGFKKVLDRYEFLRSQGQDQDLKYSPIGRQRILNGQSIDPVRSEHSFDITSFKKSIFSGKVLDVGSGGVKELEDVIPDEDITYLDKYKVPNLDVQGDAESLPFVANSFDGVYNSGMIYSPEGFEKYLSEMIRVTKEHGAIVISPMGDQGTIEALIQKTHQVGISSEQVELHLDERKFYYEDFDSEINKPQMFMVIRK